MEAPQQGGAGGVWPSLGMPAPLVGVTPGGTPSGPIPSWRLSSTEGMETAGQEELAQLFLNLESLPSTDEALSHLMQHQQQQQQNYLQQQQQQHQQYYQQQQQQQLPIEHYLMEQQQQQEPAFDLPQIEPFVVKEETASPPNVGSASGVGLSVGLYHKPRGSQGQWVGLLSHDRIRVTKGKGKKLRLEIRCTQGFNLSELTVWLVDEDGSGLHGFTVDTTKSKLEMESTGACVATLEVNLMKMGKRLQFSARVASAQGWSCQAATLPFTAHNNGKDRVQHGPPSIHSSPASPGFVHSQPASSPDPHPIPSGKKRKVSTQSEPLSSPLDAAGEKVTQLEGTLRVEGDVRARAFIQYSDLRLKTDVASLVDALNVIEKLEPKSYKWLPNAPGLPALQDDVGDDGTGGRRVIGLIAQEVQKVLPDVVYQDPVTGYLSVAYTELVPVIIEALKEHLKEYATDKAHFQQELDSLRTALSKLQSTIAPEAPGPYDGGDPDNGQDGDEAEDGGDDDSDDDENGDGGGDLANLAASQDPRDIVQTVNQRKRELRELTRQLNQIKRDAKRQHRQEKRERKTGKRDNPKRDERRNAKQQERKAALEKRKFQEHLMMDPMKLDKDVLRYQRTAFKLASKRGAQLAVALFWDRGCIPDLRLHVHKPGVALREHAYDKKKKSCTIITVQSLPRLTTSDSDSSDDEDDEEAEILGQYNVSVTLHGGFAYHLKQSRAVVAVYDFRDASTKPLTVSAASVVGDMGQTWLVGSLLVARNVFRWTQTPNVIVSSLPEDWQHADDKGQSESRSYGLLPRRVYLRAPKGYYLSASRDGTVTCTLPTQEGKKTVAGGPGFEEAWDVEFDVEGFASLRSSHGTYLSVGPKGQFATAEAAKGAGPSEKFRYLLDDASSTLALVALMPGPAYLQVSPSGELAAADALRPYACDGEEALPGQRESAAGGPVTPTGTPPSPVVVRHRAGRAQDGSDQCDSMEEEEDDSDSDDDDDSAEEEVFMQPRGHHHQQKQMAPAQPPQMRLPAEAERWVMEAAPTRDQQQARQAQEIWTQLQANFSILSLSSSLPRPPPS